MRTTPPVPPTLASLQKQINDLLEELGPEPPHNATTVYRRLNFLEIKTASSWGSARIAAAAFSLASGAISFWSLVAVDAASRSGYLVFAIVFSAAAAFFSAMAAK